MKDDLETESKPIIIIRLSPCLNINCLSQQSLVKIDILWELASYSDNLAFFSRSQSVGSSSTPLVVHPVYCTIIPINFHQIRELISNNVPII